eukprot:TRINITY_DN1439_c0_g2_i5.p3 TRINITY_DN1439_c0_g2~~TRINITY_DN1439_c0_g2_i5.p3  ORF type:complete len:128 (-),score=2.08 TRINITY_DN1439_c0_g2_i5:234-584(-)
MLLKTSKLGLNWWKYDFKLKIIEILNRQNQSFYGVHQLFLFVFMGIQYVYSSIFAIRGKSISKHVQESQQKRLHQVYFLQVDYLSCWQEQDKRKFKQMEINNMYVILCFACECFNV